MNTVGSPVVSSSKISLQPDHNTPFHYNLIKNEIVVGKVIKSYSLKNIMLLIKGQRIMAKTYMPLKEGSVISLKVEEVHPNPVLKLLGTMNENIDIVNTSIIMNGLKKNIWKKVIENIDHYLLPENDKKLFKELVDDISKKPFQKSNPALLRETFDKSGIGWEAKLRKLIASKTYCSKENISELINSDLKGFGLKIRSLIKGQDHLFDRLVSTIKNVQLLNQFGFEQERKIFIPIPIQFHDNHFSMGQLLIHLKNNKEKDDGKERGKGFYSISFLLEMSNLGPLRADLVVRKKQINGRFLIAEEKAKIIIEKQLPSLIKAFETKGFVIPIFECCIKKPVEIKDTLIKEIVSDENHNINFVV